MFFYDRQHAIGSSYHLEAILWFIGGEVNKDNPEMVVVEIMVGTEVEFKLR